MNEIISPSSKGKANHYGISLKFSTEAPAPFRGSLSEMPLRLTLAITWLTKPKNEPINGTTNPIGEKGSKTT